MKPTSTLPVTDVEGSPTLSITSARGTAVAYSWGPDQILLDQVSSGQNKSGQVKSSQTRSGPLNSSRISHVACSGLSRIEYDRMRSNQIWQGTKRSDQVKSDDMNRFALIRYTTPPCPPPLPTHTRARFNLHDFSVTYVSEMLLRI